MFIDPFFSMSSLLMCPSKAFSFLIHIFISRISFLFFLRVRLVYFLALISFLEVTKIWNNRRIAA